MPLQLPFSEALVRPILLIIITKKMNLSSTICHKIVMLFLASSFKKIGILENWRFLGSKFCCKLHEIRPHAVQFDI